MTQDLAVEVLQDPSHGFTGVPNQRGGSSAAAVDEVSAELRVRLFPSGTGLSILAIPRGTLSPDSAAWHEAPLEVSAEELLDRADRLLAIWRDQVVGHRNTSPGYRQQVGSYPLADAVDLTELRTLTDPLVAKLADEGESELEALRSEIEELTRKLRDKGG